MQRHSLLPSHASWPGSTRSSSCRATGFRCPVQQEDGRVEPGHDEGDGHDDGVGRDGRRGHDDEKAVGTFFP